MTLKTLLKNFNLLATTSRGNESQICFELAYLLKDELGDLTAQVAKSGIRGLVVAKTHFASCEVIEKFRAMLHEHPYKFRYALRVIPIEKVVPTDLEEIKSAASELATNIEENETYRVTVEKRFTSLHSKDLIEAAVTGIEVSGNERKVNLVTPDKILLIEVVGRLTGMALIKPSDVLVVLKEKML